jgi:diguanylate cyclase (GGDEF)-like protein
MLKDIIPDLISTVIANTIVVCSLMFFLMGLQRFMERKSGYLAHSVYLVFFFFLYYYFRIIDPVYKYRVLLFSVSVVIIIAQSVYLLICKTEKDQRAIYKNIAIMCILMLVLYIFRVAAVFLIYPHENEFFSAGITDSAIMMASQMLGIMMTFSLVLMINMRLFTDVQIYVEERELMVQELRRLASTDGLTGIYNRSKIEQILTIEVLRARRYKHPLSVIIADIDHFKIVNDTYGHNVGDVVLTGIASMLKEHVREVDLVGRWGGEEFLVVCPETTVDGARKLAEKLRKKIEKHHFKDIGIKTISMGVTQIEKDDWDEDMIKRADKNLYKAKRAGRNRVV